MVEWCIVVSELVLIYTGPDTTLMGADHLNGRLSVRKPLLLHKDIKTHVSAYTSQTRAQQRFTISEVAADWHELMIPRRIMRPSIVLPGEQLFPRCSTCLLYTSDAADE